GGGIGGLAAAICLARNPDISVEIFEAAKEFSEVGAGIGVWPRIWKTLALLGLDEDLARLHAIRPTYDLSDVFIFRKADQPQGHDFYKLTTQGSFLRYHRPDVLQVLIDHLPERCQTHFNRRLSDYTRLPNGKIELHFTDGLVRTCDILIGSDGVKSVVRRKMLAEQARAAVSMGRPDEADAVLSTVEPKWSGIVAYRALVPTERLIAYRDAHPEQKVRIPEHNSIPVMYMGQHVNVVVYPISSGKLINVGAFHAKEELAGTPFPGPWVTHVSNQELLDAHAGWEPEVRAILQCIDRPSRWAVHTIEKLKSWTHKNVVLLGDAAHAMSPQQASGAGQAIEDAFILATLLGHKSTTLANVQAALNIYDIVRRPVAEEVAERSLVNGRLFGLQLAGLDADTETERLPEIGEAVKENWKWTWTTTADSSVDKAIRMLEATQTVARALL
ncbi:Salicylate hydroxylase, partial [Leucoagaricus sp. SymC.cos]